MAEALGTAANVRQGQMAAMQTAVVITADDLQEGARLVKGLAKFGGAAAVAANVASESLRAGEKLSSGVPVDVVAAESSGRLATSGSAAIVGAAAGAAIGVPVGPGGALAGGILGAAFGGIGADVSGLTDAGGHAGKSMLESGKNGSRALVHQIKTFDEQIIAGGMPVYLGP